MSTIQRNETVSSDSPPSGETDAKRGRGKTLGQVKVRVDGLQTQYANVVTANANREEVVVNFGIQDAWNASTREMRLRLHTRVVMNPFVAKRLLDRLDHLKAQPGSALAPAEPSSS